MLQVWDERDASFHAEARYLFFPYCPSQGDGFAGRSFIGASGKLWGRSSDCHLHAVRGLFLVRSFAANGSPPGGSLDGLDALARDDVPPIPRGAAVLSA